MIRCPQNGRLLNLASCVQVPLFTRLWFLAGSHSSQAVSIACQDPFSAFLVTLRASINSRRTSVSPDQASSPSIRPSIHLTTPILVISTLHSHSRVFPDSIIRGYGCWDDPRARSKTPADDEGHWLRSLGCFAITCHHAPRTEAFPAVRSAKEQWSISLVGLGLSSREPILLLPTPSISHF